MSQKEKIINEYDEKLEEITKKLFKSPIKMQIILYLFIFHEISLSQMTELLQRPKTTLHHHLNQLENENYIESREQKTKNYREKLYKIHPYLLKFIKSEDNLMKINIKTNQKHTLMFIIKSFSTYITTVLDRLFNLVNISSENNVESLNEVFLRVYHIEKNQYQSAREKITQLFQDLKKEKIISTKKAHLKESYIIFNIFAPYGNLFSSFFRK